MVSPWDYPLPDHCEPISPFLTFVSSYLHVCLPTPLGFLSSLLGTLSIFSWLFAQIPQIYQNYRYQSTTGLSFYFLAEWCLGDTANLIGALLTGQATWQVVLAVYYTIVDATLVLQYCYYTYILPWRMRKPVDVLIGQSTEDSESWDGYGPAPDSPGSSFSKDSKDSKTSKNERDKKRRMVSRSASSSSPPAGIASTQTLLVVSMLCAVLANAMPMPNPPLGPVAIAANPISASAANAVKMEPLSWSQVVGRVSSWLSTAMYLCSRLPQIIKNYQRKSTTGLSPLLFLCAFLGNLFYSASMVANPNAWSDYPAFGGHGWVGLSGNKRWQWISSAAPFFLGAAGVLMLDATVGVQFMLYKDDSPEMLICVNGKKESRWMKVTGWMRGWVPSISPRGETETGEREALVPHGAENGYGSV